MNVTTCIGCGQTDDHPHHVTVVNAQHDSVSWHFDCHSASSAACESCARQLEGSNGAKGEALRAHLIPKAG